MTDNNIISNVESTPQKEEENPSFPSAPTMPNIPNNIIEETQNTASPSSPLPPDNVSEPNITPKEELIVIKYTDYFGVTHDIEVTKEFAEKYYGIIKEEKRIERKETRRHISLEFLSQKGIEFPSSSPDPLDTIIQQEKIKETRKLIASLSPAQQKLIKQLFYQNLSFSQIAQLEGVTPSAIRHRWGRLKSNLL